MLTTLTVIVMMQLAMFGLLMADFVYYDEIPRLRLWCHLIVQAAGSMSLIIISSFT